MPAQLLFISCTMFFNYNNIAAYKSCSLLLISNCFGSSVKRRIRITCAVNMETLEGGMKFLKTLLSQTKTKVLQTL